MKISQIRPISVILASVCALGLTACGNKPAENTQSAPTASQPASTVQANTAPASSNSATATATTTAGKKIRIATEGAYKPFNYTNTDGSLGGYDVDVAKAVCAELKADCEIKAQDWEGILPGLISQKYDVIFSGMSHTPERASQVDFSQPYFKNTVVWLASTKGKFNPDGEIKGYKLGTQRSTTQSQTLEEKMSKDNQVKLYDTYDNAYMDLKSGRLDAVLSEKVTGAEWLKQNQGEFGFVGKEMDNNDNIAAAVRKGDPLKGEIDKALATLQANGELAKLQQKHFGQ